MIDDLKFRLNDFCIICYWSIVGSDINILVIVYIILLEVGYFVRYVIGVLIIILVCRECYLILRLSY